MLHANLDVQETNMDAPLTHESLSTRLTTTLIGRTMYVYPSIDSTNTRAVELAKNGAPDGTLVLAEEQIAGRGRLGRQWLSPPGSSLLFSIILRPNLEPRQMQRLAMITSLAACEAVDKTTGLTVHIKWPNDLQISGCKVGGMLCEAGLNGQRLAFVVVGLGINVNLSPVELGKLMVPATSLSHELGREVERLPLLSALLEYLDAAYQRLSAGWLPHEDWRSHLATLGQEVRVGLPGQVINGLAEDVDADGALLVRQNDGSLITILAGDVTLRGHSL
jgi:BirA family transcriptional regulator, biotin operon repressor / biotin---[acetyl-CoA-carboxylase] ligase